jgi:hypothetical protein
VAVARSAGSGAGVGGGRQQFVELAELVVEGWCGVGSGSQEQSGDRGLQLLHFHA